MCRGTFYIIEGIFFAMAPYLSFWNWPEILPFKAVLVVIGEACFRFPQVTFLYFQKVYHSRYMLKHKTRIDQALSSTYKNTLL